MEFFDTNGDNKPWNGEEIKVRVSVYGLIERGERDDRALLMTRSKMSPFLELPGGGLEPGKELLREALVREGLEEIQCALNVEQRPFWQEEHGFYDQYVKTFFHALNLWFFATTTKNPSVPKGSTEVKDILWIPMASLLPRMEQIHPVNRAVIRALVAHRRETRL